MTITHPIVSLSTAKLLDACLFLQILSSPEHLEKRMCLKFIIYKRFYYSNLHVEKSAAIRPNLSNCSSVKEAIKTPIMIGISDKYTRPDCLSPSMNFEIRTVNIGIVPFIVCENETANFINPK